MASRRVRALVGAAVASLVTSGLLVGVAAAGGQPRDSSTDACPAPSLSRTTGGGLTTPNGTGPSGGGTGPVPDPATHPGLDMDGDGSVDAVSVTGTTLTITRGDGTITMTGLPSSSPGSPPFSNAKASDLDGDGKDDLWATAGDPTGYPSTAITWVVSGSTAPGTYDFGETAFSYFGYVIGDAIGDDGRNDALEYGPPISGPGFRRLADHLRSFAGLFHDDATDGSFPIDSVSVATRTDLDHDGQLDTVYLVGPGGSAGVRSQVAFSSGGSVPFPDTPDDREAFPAVRVVRDGTQTFLDGQATVLGNVYTTRFAVHAACAGPWIDYLGRIGLDRPPTSVDVGGLARTADPTMAERRAAARALFTSPDGRRFTVRLRYAHLLGRQPDPGGLEFWTRAMLAGRRNTEELEGALYGSTEFARKNADWIQAMYVTALGRDADPSGHAYWTAKAERYSHERVARMLLGSAAARRERARILFAALRSAPPSADELTFAVAVLRQFDGEDTMLAGIASGDDVYLDQQG